MKGIALFISLFLSLQTIGQKQFDFDFSQKTLYEAIEQLSGKHKFKFSYNPDELKKYVINKKIKANSEAQLISEIFEDLPFKIQLLDGVYLIIPSKIPRSPTSLAGSVYDKETGKPLAFAHVRSPMKGTTSNQDGRFTLPPRKDTITLEVSYIGYQSLRLEVPPNQRDVTMNLEVNPLLLKEVILDISQQGEVSGKPSFFSLNPEQFNALPTLGGTDVFKSIQLLPGVQASDETASGLTVRGGTPSQNLVQMDGFTLYHLDHFFGVFSTLNPNVINNVTIHKGGFGAEYGGRVSSVVDVSGKSGSMEKVSAKAGVNLLSFDGLVEMPVGSKSSFLLGTRQSFTGILNSGLFKDFLASNRKAFLESISPEVTTLNLQPTINFYDVNSKFQHRFSSNSSVDVNVYISEDSYEANFSRTDDFSRYTVQDAADWQNSGISLGWKLNINPMWHSNLTLGVSDYSENEKLAINQVFFQDAIFSLDSTETLIGTNEDLDLFNFQIKSSVKDISVKSAHEIELPNEDLIRAGVEVNSISTSYDADQFFRSNFVNEFSTVDTLALNSRITSAYGSYLFRGSNINSSIGIRGTFYNPTNKIYLEPRFDIGFKITQKLNLKGAASFHHQFVNQTSLSFFDNSDKFYWVLSDDQSIPILKSTHFIFGGDYSWSNWTIDLEYYRKNTTGILENRFVTRTPEGLAFIQNEDLDFSGENISEGLDFFLKYRSERFTSWLSYSLGTSNNRFWYINQNNPYPSNQDQRHEIKLTNIFKIKNWELSNLLVASSGKPFSAPTLEGDSIIYFDDTRVNDQRLPAYFRLDVAAKYSFTIGRFDFESGITLFNLLNRLNIKSRRFTEQIIFAEQSDEIDTDQVNLVALDTRLLGFTPNFFFNIRF